MAKKLYELADLEIVRFTAEDVIATSDDPDAGPPSCDDCPGLGENPGCNSDEF